jgi:hypothetical protein
VLSRQRGVEDWRLAWWPTAACADDVQQDAEDWRVSGWTISCRMAACVDDVQQDAEDWRLAW